MSGRAWIRVCFQVGCKIFAGCGVADSPEHTTRTWGLKDLPQAPKTVAVPENGNVRDPKDSGSRDLGP